MDFQIWLSYQAFINKRIKQKVYHHVIHSCVDVNRNRYFYHKKQANIGIITNRNYSFYRFSLLLGLEKKKIFAKRENLP